MTGNASSRDVERDSGLEQALRQAGGVAELARRLGISQPSVSAWRRIPAERVLAVADATGLSRTLLRPDLYPEGGERAVDEIDLARAREYALLARLTLRAPDTALLRGLAALRGDASALGMARIALAQAAAATDPASVGEEFFDLFIGVGRGEVLPYASFYRTGFLHERPLSEVRTAMRGLGIERAADVPEPEDHIGTLCEVMAALADGTLPCDDSGAEFFARHLQPWAGRLFDDVAGAASAKFYRAVGAYGRAFIDIETEAFALPE